MFSHETVLPQPIDNIVISFVVLALFALVGRMLNGRALDGGDLLERWVLACVTGMLFTVGVGVAVVYGKGGLHLLHPVLLLGFCLYLKQARPQAASAAPSGDGRFVWLTVFAAFVLTAAYQVWRQDWSGPDGTVRLDHSDYGYFAILSKGIAEAKTSIGWAATMGEHAVEAGRTGDVWYHWGPIWLGMLLTRITGLPAIDTVLFSTGIITCTIALLLVTALVRALTGWGLMRSLALALLSLIAMPYPESLRDYKMFGHIEHSRESFYFFISYYYEAVIVFAALLAWLRGRNALLFVLLLCGAFSSPHFFGGAGLAVGVLMCGGLLLRKKELFRPAAAAVGILLLGWGIVRGLFGSETPVSAGKDGLSFMRVLAGIGYGGLSSGVELLVCLLLVPGWVLLMRWTAPEHSADGSASTALTSDQAARARWIGWLALSGVIGGQMATYIFNFSEQLHFSDFPATLLAMPAGIWGLTVLLRSGRLPLRALALLLIGLTTVFGLTTLIRQKKDMRPSALTVTRLTDIRKTLGGEPFGYFTTQDRAWWLPGYSSLAALLDTRCIRLWPLKSADLDNRFSRAASDFLPLEMVPMVKDEPIGAWSLRFIRRLHLKWLLSEKGAPLPDEVRPYLELVSQGDGIKLYRILETAAPVPSAPPSTAPAPR
jgi:hypothetical protein